MAQKLSNKAKAAKARRDKRYAMTADRRKKKAENQRGSFGNGTKKEKR